MTTTNHKREEEELVAEITGTTPEWIKINCTPVSIYQESITIIYD